MKRGGREYYFPVTSQAYRGNPYKKKKKKKKEGEGRKKG